MRVAIAGVLLLAFLATSARAEEPASSEARTRSLASTAERLQKRFKGRIAVFVSDPELGIRAGHDFERPSYLASGVKVAFMLEVFRQEHEGRLSLDEELTYEASDLRDGAPRLNKAALGARFKIRELLEFMIQHSDNAASDMLARRVGIHNINHGLKVLGFEGFTPITRLIDVRRGILREVDVHADDFTPLQIRTVRWVTGWHGQAAKLTELLGKPPGTYTKDDLQAAFHRYYATETNGARLDSAAALLEQLALGKLISPEASTAMLALLTDTKTSRNRILGKLPRNTKVAHKTGSQWERICDLGIITLPDGHPLVFTACLAGGDNRNLAEATLAELARHAYDQALAAHKSHTLRASSSP